VYASQRRRRRRNRKLLAVGTLVALVVLLAVSLAVATRPAGSHAETEEARKTYARAATPSSGPPEAPSPRHAKPQAVKGIYLTAATAGSSSLDAYLDFLDRTELNAVVIDVKDVTGEVMYPSEVRLAREIGATREIIPDLEAMVSELKERNVYVIARLTVFEDNILPRERPDLAATDSSTGGPWLNYNGDAWADPYDREVWEYNVAIAREVAEAGFDEIQFDYVRFPSDGPMETLQFGEITYPTKEAAIAGFLEYAHNELEPTGAYVAADVFGLAATEDGAGVGQFIDELAAHLDVLCPMAYPSHYPGGSYGYPYPNQEPYGVVSKTLADFKDESGPVNPDLEIRPWLQDFDYGPPPYGPEEIEAQIQATYDAGETGWLLWNPSNVYTEGALMPEGANEER
jgi:hypothetical protein